MSETTLKPGVVTGDGYKTLVEAAKQGGYALPAVNVVGTNSINAVMEAAAKAKSDIIIQLSNSGGAFFRPLICALFPALTISPRPFRSIPVTVMFSAE